MNPPHGRAELEARYGKLLLDRDPRGGFRIMSPIGWEIANMTKLVSPLLPYGKLYVHKDMAEPLRAALARAVAAAPDYAIRTIGCWAVRYKRTAAKQVSLHAYGLAVDLNASTNPMQHPLTTDIPGAFVRAFEAEGFTWGGDWGLPDPMHFQWASGI